MLQPWEHRTPLSQRDYLRDYLRRYLGRMLSMLMEEEVEISGKACIRGHSENYLLLYLPVAAAGAQSLLPVRAVEPMADGLLVENI